MTIRHWDAPVKILSVYFEKDFSSDRKNTTVTAQLLAPYGDGSGKAGKNIAINPNQLNADGGWPEISSAIERLINQDRKEQIMSAIEKSYDNKSLRELAEMYNSMVPKEKQIKKFKDKATAIKRMADAFKNPVGAPAPKKDSSGTNKSPAIKQEKTPAKLAKAATVVAQQFKIVGRKSQFAGKKIYKLCKENPRRPGGLAHGWHNWSVYRDGMTYEEYILAKGLTNQLRWDIEHGFVEVK